MILWTCLIFILISDINGLLLTYSLDYTCTAIFGRTTIMAKNKVFIIMVRLWANLMSLNSQYAKQQKYSR